MRTFFLLLATIVASAAFAEPGEPPAIRRTVDVPQFDVVAHDPVIIKEGGTYYLFTTGPGVSVWTSPDMERWTMQDPVFETLPEWTDQIPGFNGHMWAPDISKRGDQYYLYYSVSSFGKNDSAIGVATNKTLDQDSSEYGWTDHGIVVRSQPGIDDWNAIDPNLVFDEEGQPYLAFGSFWSGLKIAELTNDLTELANPDAEPMAIASRRERPESQGSAEEASLTAGNGAIEGPFIYRHDDYYYLFASVDYCCRGVDSTYKMIYGRSDDLLGPYVDKDGVRLLDGGGSLLKEGDERWQGIGHNAVVELDGKEYAIYHGYDGETERGLPKLHIARLGWTADGWPYIIEEE